MTDLVTDEMVETAARVYHEAVPEAVAGSWDVSTPRIHERAAVTCLDSEGGLTWQ